MTIRIFFFFVLIVIRYFVDVCYIAIVIYIKTTSAFIIINSNMAMVWIIMFRYSVCVLLISFIVLNSKRCIGIFFHC